MAITHSGWLAADSELNRAAKAATLVSFPVAHDCTSLVICTMTRSGAQALAKINFDAKSLRFLDAQCNWLTKLGHELVATGPDRYYQLVTGCHLTTMSI